MGCCKKRALYTEDYLNNFIFLSYLVYFMAMTYLTWHCITGLGQQEALGCIEPGAREGTEQEQKNSQGVRIWE